MRALGVLAIALTLLLAGCTGGGSSDPTSTTGPAGSTTSKPAGTTTTAPPGGSTTAPPSSSSGAPTGNTAPVADLQAATTTGPAPLAVTFLVNATDADGDALTYNLTFGDGSPNSIGDWTVVKEIARTYATAGTYTAILNISDGTTFGLDELTITVESSGPAFTPIHQEGTIKGLCTQCGAEGPYNTCVGLRAEVNELDCFFFEIPPEAAGHLATADSDNGFVNYEILSDCSGSGTGVARFVDGPGSSPYSFVIPQGAGCLLFFEWFDFPPVVVVDIV